MITNTYFLCLLSILLSYAYCIIIYNLIITYYNTQGLASLAFLPIILGITYRASFYPQLSKVFVLFLVPFPHSSNLTILTHTKCLQLVVHTLIQLFSVYWVKIERCPHTRLYFFFKVKVR